MDGRVISCVKRLNIGFPPQPARQCCSGLPGQRLTGCCLPNWRQAEATTSWNRRKGSARCAFRRTGSRWGYQAWPRCPPSEKGNDTISHFMLGGQTSHASPECALQPDTRWIRVRLLDDPRHDVGHSAPLRRDTPRHCAGTRRPAAPPHPIAQSAPLRGLRVAAHWACPAFGGAGSAWA